MISRPPTKEEVDRARTQILKEIDLDMNSSDQAGLSMSEWMAIAQWQDCVKMDRPRIIFEIRNAEGQSLFTPCVSPLPTMPFD